MVQVVKRFTDQFPKCTAVELLCHKGKSLVLPQLFATSTVIPVGKRTIRWYADTRGECTDGNLTADGLTA